MTKILGAMSAIAGVAVIMGAIGSSDVGRIEIDELILRTLAGVALIINGYIGIKVDKLRHKKQKGVKR